jgi:uncharacterized protein YoxC
MSEGLGETSNSAPIDVIYRNGGWYIHAYPVLTALGANVSVENGALKVIMPFNNFWKTLKAAYDNFSLTSLTLDSEYGDTGGLRIGMDYFVDAFTPGGYVSILNPFGTLVDAATDKPAADIIEASLFESIDRYESVKNLISEANQAIESFSKSWGKVKDLTKLANDISFDVVTNELISNGFLTKGASSDEVMEAMKRAGFSNLFDDIDNIGDAVSAVNTSLEFMSTVSNRLSVEPEKIEALSDTFSESNLLQISGLDDYPRFFGTARDVAERLSNKGTTILGTVSEVILDGLLADVSNDAILEGFGSTAGSLFSTLNLGGIVINLVIPGQIDAASSDISVYLAIQQLEWLNDIVSGWRSIAMAEDFTNEETLKHLRNSYIVYYQTCLYAHRQILSMAENAPERFGTVVDVVKQREAANCDRIAGVLYRLYSSQPTAAPIFDDIVSDSEEQDASIIGIGFY